MDRERWKIVILVLSGLGAVAAKVAQLAAWPEALTPGFVGLTVGEVVAVVTALVTAYFIRPDQSPNAVATRSRYYSLVLVLALPALFLLATPTRAAGQEPAKPNAPPALAGCAFAEWRWNAAERRWDAACASDPTQARPSALPAMGFFCGRSDWEWRGDEARWVQVCVLRSKPYQALRAAGVAVAGINASVQLTDLAQGRIDSPTPTVKPWSGTPWAAGAVQAGLVVGQALITDDWFREHPTLSGFVDVAMLCLRAGELAYVAATAAPLPPRATGAPHAGIAVAFRW